MGKLWMKLESQLLCYDRQSRNPLGSLWIHAQVRLGNPLDGMKNNLLEGR